MQFDYSNFHPLDHPIAAPECFRWYGGPWRHAEYWLTFRGPDALAPLHKALFCRRNIHDDIPFWATLERIDPDNPDGFTCRWCFRDRH